MRACKLLKILLLFMLFLCNRPLSAQERFVSFAQQEGGFQLARNGVVAPTCWDLKEVAGVVMATKNLQSDIQKVTGRASSTINQLDQGGVIYIATIGTPIATHLIKLGVIKPSDLENRREKFIITTFDTPTGKSMAIVGSDRRGTIYGIYELSSQIGVSPWYYWADVPPEKHSNITILNGIFTASEPAVRYRGIFLNDEAPALTGWVRDNFGGYNHKFYEKVFELLLRLRGNFLWPAMWDAAFYDDDPENSALADKMGIIMGTSHHEPMARAHKEWRKYGSGEWNYSTNSAVLNQFWRGGMERVNGREDLITIGMRGDGDEPMSRDANIALLEKIVREQRKIIEKTTNKKAAQTPQVWALYKEVQEYYDKGMRVPDDVTLLLCDDNWGNVRKLPSLGDKPRSGGYGMYYHFDYVGAPRNSKWVNINPIPRMWEQLNLTYHHGVDRLWIVNVGDLKPMEYPITFFLDMAWNPDNFNANNLAQHTEQWCAEQFGASYAKECARLISLYTKYNRRVTPEILNDSTYSLENYDEWERVKNEYEELANDALKLYYLMPNDYRNAYDQLVLYPIQACSNLYLMYYAVAMNKRLAQARDPRTNDWADKVQQCFERDSILSHHYNHVMNGGKWNHFADQTHIGYTSWQEPRRNIMPKVIYLEEKRQPSPQIFTDENGYISIEAQSFTKAVNDEKTSWTVIPNLGRTRSGLTTMPATQTPDPQSCVEYDFKTPHTGNTKVIVLLSPTLNYNANKGLSYAVAVDSGAEQIVNFNSTYNDNKIWGSWNAKQINETTLEINIPQTADNCHTLRFRALDPGVVLQKLIIDTGGLKPSYLGPPESAMRDK